MSKAIDDLMYFGAGILAAKVVKHMTVKYLDPEAKLNFSSLGATAGKPSVYVPAATGAGALYYVAEQTGRRESNKSDKIVHMRKEEFALAGYGLETVLDAVVEVSNSMLQSGSGTVSTPSAGVRVINGGGMTGQRVAATQGYPPEANGNRRGMI